MRNSTIISICCVIVLFTHSAWGLLSFQVLESNQFKILYPKRHHEEAIKMLHSFENAYTQLATRFN